MRIVVLFLTLTFAFVHNAWGFDSALYTHCLQWTPRSIAEMWQARALKEGYPYLSTIPTQPSASQAYDEGYNIFFVLHLSEEKDIAYYCAKWTLTPWGMQSVEEIN